MYESTIPFGEPELLRASTYLQALDEAPGTGGRVAQLAALSPSLMADLRRFEHRPEGVEVLEVLAACLRHAHSAAVYLDADGLVLPLTVFPRQRLFHCPVDPQGFLHPRLHQLKVLRVEMAMLRPPGDDEEELIAPLERYFPIGPLLWELAMEGHRSELLPEIDGPACFRTAPDLPLASFRLRPGQPEALQRMRLRPVTLQDLSELPGLNRETASRLLNGLYLQSGLIISRALTAAIATGGSLSESWLPTLRRLRG